MPYLYGIIFQGNQTVLEYENEAEVSNYIVGVDLSFGSNEGYCLNPGIDMDTYINSFFILQNLAGM